MPFRNATLGPIASYSFWRCNGRAASHNGHQEQPGHRKVRAALGGKLAAEAVSECPPAAHVVDKEGLGFRVWPRVPCASRRR
jgi:hypothetical protein